MLSHFCKTAFPQLQEKYQTILFMVYYYRLLLSFIKGILFYEIK